MNLAFRAIRMAIAVMFPIAGIATAVAEDAEFESKINERQSQKPEWAERHVKLLFERHELFDSPAAGVAMSRDKSVQSGVQVRPWAGMILGSSRQCRRRRQRAKASGPEASIYCRILITRSVRWYLSFHGILKRNSPLTRVDVIVHAMGSLFRSSIFSGGNDVGALA